MILANKQSGARLKEQKTRYTIELKRKIHTHRIEAVLWWFGLIIWCWFVIHFSSCTYPRQDVIASYDGLLDLILISSTL